MFSEGVGEQSGSYEYILTITPGVAGNGKCH